MKKPLDNYRNISLDTNIFIYYFTKLTKLHAASEDLLYSTAEKHKKISTSIITLAELLSLKTSEENIERLEDSFSQIPNLVIVEVNRQIAILAAKIRREYNFLLPDAIQLATAININSDVFVTNDKKLQKFKEIEVILLSGFSRI